MRGRFPVVWRVLDSNIALYAFFGCLFGLVFPVCATSLDLAVRGLSLSLASVVEVQQTQPLHWIIDTAPLVLAIVASMAGRRQDAAENARSHAAAKQREAEALTERMHWLIGAMPIGLATYDGSSRLITANSAFRKFVGEDSTLERAVYQQALVAGSGSAAKEVQIGDADRAKFAVLGRLDHDPSPDGEMSVLLADVSEEKLRQQQLMQAAKLANLGELSASIAHELNQPLNHIKLVMLNLEKLLLSPEKITDTDQVKSKIGRVMQSIGRAASIIDHMRAFGRVEGLKLTPISVVSALDGSLLMTAPELKQDGILVVREVEDGLPWILGIESQLEQVLLNLIVNARDAIIKEMPSERVIHVRCYSENKEVVIQVLDSGGGMNSEQLDRIFDPFYTTKAVGSGTGLGGSISYGIVSSFGGRITAQNWSSGAMIEMKFPAIDDPPTALAGAQGGAH